tara:strand:- start:1866 stop:1997 length:132 start_codon:yes stop_codon:yes gene_type:complete
MTRQAHGNEEDDSEQEWARMFVAHPVLRLPEERRRVVAEKALL